MSIPEISFNYKIHQSAVRLQMYFLCGAKNSFDLKQTNTVYPI